MLKQFIKKHKSRILICVLIFLWYTVLGLFNFVRFVTNELALGRDANYLFYFIMETTGVYAHLALLPVIYVLVRKFPINRNNLTTHIPLHIFASMLVGASHTLLMYFSRHFIFWLGNLGTYDYGNIYYRFIMEYSHQATSYWIWYAGIQLYRLVRKNQEHKIKTARLEEQLTKAKLQALQMQIRPHFLFNTLNMISATIYEDIHAADKMIANLSDLLRQTLDGVQNKTHTLEKELELVRLYVNIMQARFADKLQINLAIEKDVYPAQVPGFILQPLIENAITHGMEKLTYLAINISGEKADDKLLLKIIDNGPGITPVNEKNGQGIGLSNIAERLEKIYNQNHKFYFQNIGSDGFEVVIEIPFRKE